MIKIKKTPPGVKGMLEGRGATKLIPKNVPPRNSPEDIALTFVFATAYVVGAADGELTDEEYETLGQMLADVTGLDISAEQLDSMLEASDKVLQEQGYESAIEELSHMAPDPELRRSAYTIAVAVGCADGALADEEVAVFSALADAYEIPEEEATAIIDECAAAYSNG
ncbi:MAG: tellurite resistance TerB family protein [Myxococcales bacterium]|nr:tellurite resistance TerB family protein [Myxococcales bacterium]